MWSLSLLRFEAGFSKIGKRVKYFSLSTCRTEKERKLGIEDVLNRVKKRDGLKPIYPHIEYLIGRTSDGGGDKRIKNLGISDKTHLILQSSHPVRYIVQREIKNLRNDDDRQNQISYHDWITIFARCLVNQEEMAEIRTKFESQINHIANAADCGMFSSEIHQTVLNIPDAESWIQSETLKELNLGNKYAVLVGDYFSIKAIFFSEKAKCNQVILSITRGVEDFTSALVSSNLMDSNIWTLLVPSLSATTDDWIQYNSRVCGYFTGGLYAVLNVLPEILSLTPSQIEKFVKNLALLIKTVIELDELRVLDRVGQNCDRVGNINDEELITSPFILTSLPAIIFQNMYPTALNSLRRQANERSNFKEEVYRIRQEILKSNAISETLHLMRQFGTCAKFELSTFASNSFYVSIFNELVDILIETSKPK